MLSRYDGIFEIQRVTELFQRSRMETKHRKSRGEERDFSHFVSLKFGSGRDVPKTLV